MKKGKQLLQLTALLLCTVFVLLAFAGCGQSGQKASSDNDASEGNDPNQPDNPGVPPEREDAEGINADKVDPPITNLTMKGQYKDMSDIDLSRYAGAEGMVLLENSKNTLPLTKDDTVALFGAAQINFIKGGTGSGDVNALYVINALQGIQNKEKEGKVKLYAKLSEAYEKNASYVPSVIDAKNAAKNANKAIVFISRNSGENVDVTRDKYYLSTAEKNLLKTVSEAGFKGITVVLNVGTAMDTSFLADFPAIDSVLISWQAGLEGGNALADVLVGDVNPSGKLADTMASSYDDYPSSKNFDSASVYATYSEDIYVGYRYFETFDPEYKKVNYPFGYGLSYTSFEIGTPTVKCDGTYIEAAVTVKNTGAVSGMEVVQLYYSAPKGLLGAPGKCLAAFAKTDLLEPGQSQTLKLTFAVTDMARFDDTGKIQKYAYVMETGDYTLYLGNSIQNAGQRGVIHTYRLHKNTVTKQLDDLLSDVTLGQRLTADGKYENVYTGSDSIVLKEGKTVVPATDYLVQYHQTQLDANADGTVYGMNLSGGNSLIFTFTPASAGEFTLTLGFGNGGTSTVANAFVVTVNGIKNPMMPPLTPTGNKFTIKQTAAIPITLKEGVNKIEVGLASLVSDTVLLSTLTLDDGSGAGETSLLAKPQKVFTPSKKMNFKQVYETPELLESFLKTLTPSEMIYLLCGHGANVGHGDGSLAGLTDKGVPFVDTSDGPAGLDLTVPQVAWPIETALACTWNTDLIYAVGQKVGEECYTAGVDIWLAPGINIHRDPLGGRNFEYFSEDPLLTGKMASAITQGVQSVDGVGVMIKHLYANSREAYRVDGDSHISLRAAREIYLKAFEICIKEADPWSVMTTYNTANGMFNSENRELLTGILRDEWGFKGMVCTDWGAHSQQFREIAAGNDAKMSWGYPESTLAAYRCGELPYVDLYNSAKRMLEIALKSGSMERLINPPPVVVPVHTVTGEGATKIKASAMKSHSDGIGTEACLDTDGGIIPNYCQDGRNIAYSIDVKKAGTYGFAFRVASENKNSSFKLYVDDDLIGTFSWAEGSGGWQVWQTKESDLSAALTVGEHTVKLVFATALNLNWFTLTPTA